MITVPKTMREYWRMPVLTDNQWALGMVDMFPRSWRSRLLHAWRVPHRGDARGANLSLLGRVHQLADSARGGIRPDASDGDICQQADITASDFARRLGLVAAIAKQAGAAVIERLQAFYCRHLLRQRGLLDMWPVKTSGAGKIVGRINRAGAIGRMKCARFWRRQFRKLHARTVEACAIDIGLVRRTEGVYCSDDTARRSLGQDARNAAVLESVSAVNDLMQQYTLAELAAKGVANMEIRRQELLARIAGFELIAKDCGHLAFMVTVTCPSRFHPCTTLANGQTVDNRKFQKDLSPRHAQTYLAEQWKRCRSAAARAGLEWYGFRIAEPQHDATPHWHMLLFFPHSARGIDAAVLLQALVRRYFLENDSPNEPGAQKHRCDFEMIDWARGSAVGYVIKYISKNIDGHGVGLDLFGNDAITSSQRVRAWARTWRIRQFQQVGGAPVTIWRELRRVHPENVPDNAPEALRAAMSAINVGKIEPGIQAIAWKKYQAAQGGVHVRRDDLRIKLIKEETGELGRYGEVSPAYPVGVEAHGIELFRNHIHEMRPNAPLFERRTTMGVESERAEWFIGGRDPAVAAAAAAAVFQRSGEAAQPRIHVNNCTRPDPGRVSMFAPTREHRQKLRRFARFEPPPGRPPGTLKTGGASCATFGPL